MTERYYRPELDLLRLFAFVAVFSSHLPFRNRHLVSLKGTGNFGMCIFFLLSAFLIATLLLRELDATNTVRLMPFAMRRVLRIWPLYFFALALFYAVGRICPSVHIPLQAVLAFSLLSGNVYILRHGWMFPTANALWSLSVEEQFYAGIPGLVRFGGSAGFKFFCYAALGLAYGVLIWLGMHRASPIGRVWPNSFVQFQFFAVGELLAVAFRRKRLRLVARMRLACWCTGLILWICANRWFALDALKPSSVNQLVPGYLFVLIGTVAIFISIYEAEFAPPTALLYLGKISYGLYIFHQFWIWFVLESDFDQEWTLFFAEHRWFGTGLALLATIGSAAISYRFLELPMLRLKSQFEVIRSRPE